MSKSSTLKIIQREMAIVRVEAAGSTLENALELVGANSGRLLHLDTHSFTAEVSGEPSKVDRLVDRLSTFGLCTFSRSGVVIL